MLPRFVKALSPIFVFILVHSFSVGAASVSSVSFSNSNRLLSTTVVISQVFSGGGGASGAWNRDYVELHNISLLPQSLDGFALQYGSATGNFGSAPTLIFAFPNGIVLPAGGYYLIQTGTTAGINVNPTTPDQTTTNIAMAAASGKLALTNSSLALSCGATANPCPLPDSRIIDLVSWGVSNNGEGGTTVNNGVALIATQSSARLYSGCTERDNNNLDFGLNNHLGSPPANTFRNSATPVFICGVTAAGVSVSGRITDASGYGIRNVRVSIVGSELTQPRTAITNAFGYYSIDDLEVGSSYVISVAAKGRSFVDPTRIISLTDVATNIDFVTSTEPFRPFTK